MNICYTNVAKIGNYIYYRGLQDEERISKKIKYKPTFYVPDHKNDTKFRTLFGEPVSPITFDSMSDANDFQRKYKDVQNYRIYGMENYVYQFLSEAFPYDMEYDLSKINVTYFDIEVASDDGFPEPRDAKHPVISIALKNNQDDTFYVWGLDDYDVTQNERKVEYFKCASEVDLLVSFTNWWASDCNTPHIISGWYTKFFDVPYLINRISNVIGRDTALKLSPWGKLQEFEDKGRYGSEQWYEIIGISHLDYEELFRKFGVQIYGQQEKFSLDHISEVVLGKNKVNYEEYGTLHGLYKSNHQLFIDYNIEDTGLVEEIDAECNFINLVLAVTYKAKCKLNDPLRTTGVWDAVVYNQLRSENVVVPPKRGHEKESIEGGYVKEPLVLGVSKNIVSFDYDSLYPNIMVQYNISPETIVDPDLQKKQTIPANHMRFTTDFEGVFPRVIKKFYGDRSLAKQKMLECKQEFEKTGDRETKKMIGIYNSQQHAIKILMNSLYGAVANRYFRYYHKDMAEAVTLSGQRAIKWAESAMNKELNKILNTDTDYVLAIDTDSIYVNMDPLVQKVQPKDPISFLDKACEDRFVKVIDEACHELAEQTDSYINRMIMKREVIADRGLWTAKKRYILQVHDNEGVRYEKPQLKIMGIEAIKSSTPRVCRDKMKELFSIILNGTEDDTHEFIAEFKKEFYSLPPEAMSLPKSVNSVQGYADSRTIYQKGTPINSRGALLFNHHVKMNKLEKKYELIKDGEKIKYTYLRMPNPIKENVIAFHTVLPKELKLHKYIDYNLMYEKTFVDPVQLVLEPLGWTSEPVATLDDFMG